MENIFGTLGDILRPENSKDVRKNTKEIVLTLTDTGLKRFQKVPTFNNLLHPSQIEGLQVGENKLTVNHYIYGTLLRVTEYDKNNMQISNNNQ